MSEKTKRKKPSAKNKKENPEAGDEKSWSEDQKKKSYYYDDAHGYEIYNADEETEGAEPYNQNV